MSKPRFLADEDLRYEIVQAVRRLEHSTEFRTVVEIGRSGILDPDLLEFASGASWIVVSHDVNTLRAEAEKRIQDGMGIAGLLLVPQSRRTRPVAESLHLIWSASEAEEWKDRVVFLPL